MLSDPFARITLRVPNAAALSAHELSGAVAERYALLERLLRELGRRPIRIWNYVPAIVEEVEPGLNRYMAFNRGRYTAFAQSWGSGAEESGRIPTASAVGIVGPDLVIDCLASSAGGEAIENPRQTASWRYSRRYGPLPPCFARGTIAEFDGDRMLLVGGTASIVGEQSRHEGDVRAQVAEALANIETLIAAAGGPPRGGLQWVSDARVYVVRDDDAPLVESLVRAEGSAAVRIETAVARVCRPELLVEIEALARLRTTGEKRD